MKVSIFWPIATATAAGFGALALMFGFGTGDLGSSAFWRARQARVDEPELWSIEAVPRPRGWEPVRICTDSVMRTGFAQPLPTTGDRSCDPTDDPTWSDGRYAFRCILNGRKLGVSATLSGDPQRAFEAAFTIAELDSFLSRRDRQPEIYVQTRRYRRLGPCPAGWRIGDNTDRNGRLRHAAAAAEIPTSEK